LSSRLDEDNLETPKPSRIKESLESDSIRARDKLLHHITVSRVEALHVNRIVDEFSSALPDQKFTLGRHRNPSG
jgi:hypothetical protein